MLWDSLYDDNVKSQPDRKIIRDTISDHAPVLVDITINLKTNTSPVLKKIADKFNLHKASNTIRLGFWNVLNYTDSDKQIPKAKAIVEVIK